MINIYMSLVLIKPKMGNELPIYKGFMDFKFYIIQKGE